jgi:phosphatidate cytidylyltransferase
MPTAIAVGVAIAAVFVAALLWRPAAALVLVVIVLGLASVEYFDKVTEKGYRPATILGIAATIALPLAAYWVGETALPLVLVLAFAAGSLGFIGAAGVESGPMPNMAITTLGITWIALLGSFAALILRISTLGGENPIGTDTLFLLALGVVANDIGALFVGSGIGRHPLRAWISPNKSVEGLVGGTIATLVVLGAIGVAGKSDTWNSFGDCLWLAVVICITAPLGDLTESMFKRNLDVKDFGTLIRGHGGILDRFDGFLFTLPATYYLLEVLQPWVTK